MTALPFTGGSLQTATINLKNMTTQKLKTEKKNSVHLTHRAGTRSGRGTSSVVPTPSPQSGEGISLERRGSGSSPACVTRFELAELLHVSVRTVDRMIAASEIRVRRVRGKVVRFLRSDVEEYLQGKN